MQLREFISSRKFSGADYAFLTVLLCAIVLLILGLILPAFLTDRIALSSESLSIVAGARKLGEEGNVAFMAIILLFSVVFPSAKLLAMLALWALRFETDTEKRTMHWLEVLGKWSMLDVFVIAITIGAANLRFLNRTTTETGVYIFAAAIFLSMIASFLLQRKLGVRLALALAEVPLAERVAGMTFGTLSLLLFFAGLMLPLFSVEKWLFWNNEYSMVTALPQMLAEQEFLLPAVILIFVIVLPLCRFLSITATRMSRQPTEKLTRLAIACEKWTMWEVYVLALIIVSVKLADFATIELRAGFWLIASVVPLSLLDGWLFRRRLLAKKL
jgi:paraquat-inducible protein A